MSIYRYGARVEVIGAKYSTPDNLVAKVKLMELFDDGSGKVGEVLELPFNQLETDGGLLEFADACERYVKLQGKELEMKTSITNMEGKSLAELTGLYNGMVPESKKVKRFSDREAAVKRLTSIIANEGRKPKKSKKPIKAPKATIAAKETVKGEGKKIKLDLTLKSKATHNNDAPKGFTLVGKKSSLSGKYLYKVQEEGKTIPNPRREGTHGWHSWNALKDGMTYEQFINNKGGNKHLQWDIDHGFVEVRSKPRTN